MIILASKSARRIELLKDAGIEFEVIGSDIKEEIDSNLKPEENAMRVAAAKAKDVFKKYPEGIIIAADTIVTLDNKIYGKPLSEENAVVMLKELSGRKHRVITGVAILKADKEIIFYSEASVLIKPLNEFQILEYVNTKEPLDKAGAYAIQGEGRNIVETYDGDFFTIVGLPLKEVLVKLKEINE